jgi:hypothetical protein
VCGGGVLFGIILYGAVGEVMFWSLGSWRILNIILFVLVLHKYALAHWLHDCLVPVTFVKFCSGLIGNLDEDINYLLSTYFESTGR